jgi:hypothetical protein
MEPTRQSVRGGMQLTTSVLRPRSLARCSPVCSPSRSPPASRKTPSTSRRKRWATRREGHRGEGRRRPYPDLLPTAAHWWARQVRLQRRQPRVAVQEGDLGSQLVRRVPRHDQRRRHSPQRLGLPGLQDPRQLHGDGPQQTARSTAVACCPEVRAAGSRRRAALAPTTPPAAEPAQCGRWSTDREAEEISNPRRARCAMVGA